MSLSLFSRRTSPNKKNPMSIVLVADVWTGRLVFEVEG